ncbi:restriction endonuclease subunit S [Pseudoalteromonas sp. NCIMB_1079]|uniref:restriction endonuclease subunit S n=1 Tax=Pseudoalteromonas sp. NCIMB 1079 TaxID=3142847 RepID=UPI00339BF3F7
MKYKSIKIEELVKSGEAKLQTGPFGTQLKASDYTESGVPVINVRNVGFGNIRTKDLEYLGEKMVEQLSVHQLEKGDIVFGRKGAVERHAYIDGIGEGWIQGSDCLRLRLNSDRVDNRFVSYYLRTKTHQDWMIALCSFGATMPSLNQDIVKLITFPAPPIDIQRKVTGILSAYDELIEVNKSRISLLSKVVQETFKEWFVRFRFPGFQEAKFDKGIPETWSIKSILDESNFKLIKPNVDQFEGDKKYYATAQVDEITLLSPTALVSYSNRPSRAQYQPTENSVWFARMKNTYKILSVSNEDKALINNAILSSGFVGLEAKETWYPFLYSLISSRNFHDTKDVYCTGATQESLTNSGLKQIKVLIPEKELVLSFSKIIRPVIDQIDDVQAVINKIEIQKNALLSRILSGKLKVDDLDVIFSTSKDKLDL